MMAGGRRGISHLICSTICTSPLHRWFVSPDTGDAKTPNYIETFTDLLIVPNVCMLPCPSNVSQHTSAPALSNLIIFKNKCWRTRHFTAGSYASYLVRGRTWSSRRSQSPSSVPWNPPRSRRRAGRSWAPPPSSGGTFSAHSSRRGGNTQTGSWSKCRWRTLRRETGWN